MNLLTGASLLALAKSIYYAPKYYTGRELLTRCNRPGSEREVMEKLLSWIEVMNLYTTINSRNNLNYSIVRNR